MFLTTSIKQKKKTVDFIVYFKSIRTKKSYLIKLINKLIKLKFNVYCIGD